MKMRVGQIEIDEAGGVFIHSSSISGAPTTPAAPDSVGERPGDGKAPSSPGLNQRTLYALGAAALVCAVGLLLVGIVGNPLLLITVLPGLLFGSGVTFVLGRRAGKQALLPPSAEDTELARTRGTRVAALLSTCTAPSTVEQIAQTLAWTEDAAVMGLRYLVGQGRAVEDLDVESGHWTYALARPDDERVPAAALPLEDRAKETRLLR